MVRDCCDMRGMLSFLLLFLLSKKPMHGQALASELASRKGSRPSPGTIYPALKCLKEMGFISQKKKGKNIVYALTPEGRLALREAKAQFVRTFMGLFSE